MLPLIIIGLLCVVSGNAVEELPCHYLDSINITGGFRWTDGSIQFDGILYPKEEYATIDYILKDGTDKIEIEPHIRGCTCSLAPCIRLCCPLGTHWIKQNKTSACVVHEEAKKFEGKVLQKNNETEDIIFEEQFAYVHGKPCKFLYLDEDYRITHKGEVLHGNGVLTHHDYCLRARLNNETNRIDLEQLICYEAPDDKNIKYLVLAVCMLISVLFIIVTLMVYCFVSKLRNLQGKILICYLIGLAIGYSLMAFILFNGSNYVIPEFCYSIGYTTLFSFLSAFLWLNVMNFDFWLNFQSSHCLKLKSEKKQFFAYAFYGWCLPGFMIFMIYIFDHSESFPQKLRPGIGDHHCFLSPDNIFLYFYLPLGIIFTINIIFFISIASKIHQMQQELTIRSQDGGIQNQRALNKKKDSFMLYLRLFLVMGVVWCMEVISFLASSDGPYFLLTDIFNTLQGVFIFILFVWKRRVLHLIKERWNTWKGKINLNESETRNSASGTYVPLNFMSRTE